MNEATLTQKSQLTLPKAVLEALRISPGDKVQFVPSLDGYRLIAIRGDITSLRGVFKGRRAAPLSIDDINEAIAEMGSKREPAR